MKCCYCWCPASRGLPFLALHCPSTPGACCPAHSIPTLAPSPLCPPPGQARSRPGSHSGSSRPGAGSHARLPLRWAAAAGALCAVGHVQLLCGPDAECHDCRAAGAGARWVGLGGKVDDRLPGWLLAGLFRLPAALPRLSGPNLWAEPAARLHSVLSRTCPHVPGQQLQAHAACPVCACPAPN